ncbi:transcriptional regulator [Phycicoccus sp. CSK15P-2]|uniref:transcriptional regulator n=1 Tax=Phycicoccus sp. CSK15P-2 TaxID=2807627 RepID=UPI0019527DD8|nr:transcriptional regulator [Phycicoccus sp. CSK15P-2]MBM6403858.1 transcriptional regulator [Phycicoccus sp. CSK15P-2]
MSVDPRDLADVELDPVIHTPARLRIVATLNSLGPGDSLSFTRLQGILGLTAGNLITHLRRLEEAGYVRVERSGEGRSARSSTALTDVGRAALTTYRRSLAAILDQP